MKIRTTRMVGIFGVLSLTVALTACDGKNGSPLAPTTESTQATSVSGPAPNPAADPSTPKPPDPAPPANPVPPAPPPSEPPLEPVSPPAVGPCEVPAVKWQIKSFIRSPGSRTLVVKNNGDCTDYFGGATFIGTAGDLPGQKFYHGKVVQVGPGKTETITYNAPDNGSVCVPIQDDVFRHMSQMPQGALPDHFGPGAQYLMSISNFVESSFIECPKTCVDVEPFLSPVTLTDEGDSVSASVIPDFKSVTNNANQIIIQVIDGDMVAGHLITRDQKGVRVGLGKFPKGNAPRTYKVRLRVSDDQAQNCSSNEVTFTVPAKSTPPTDVCVGVSGSLRYENGVPHPTSWSFTVIVTLSDGATGMLITKTGNIPVNNGARMVMAGARPEPGSGPGKENVQLQPLKNNQPCGNPIPLEIPIPEKDKPVTPPPPPTPLVCTPANQTVLIGQPATFSSSGPDQPRSWSAPGGSPSSGSGVGFSTTYNTEGEKSVSVTTEGQAPAVCKVMVNKPAEPPPPPPPPTCEQQYPPKLEFASGSAQRDGGYIQVNATVLAQNVRNRAVAILWRGVGYPPWLKDMKPVNLECGPGQQTIPLSFRSHDHAHSQEGGASYELWEVTPNSQVQTPSFTLIRKLADLPWR